MIRGCSLRKIYYRIYHRLKHRYISNLEHLKMLEVFLFGVSKGVKNKMLTKEEFKENRRKAMTGKDNPRWNNGNSEYPNHAELKRVRIEILRNVKGRCEICGRPAKLVHHIDGDKINHNIENLTAVCLMCHSTLHRDDDLIPNLGRPLKYSLICGLPIKNIAERFGVCVGTIYCWIKNPKKEKWLKEQLEALD